VLGLKSSNKTRGHRFLSTGPLTIRNAKDYAKVLKQQGKVIASFETRRETIASALESAAHKAVRVCAGISARAPSWWMR